ncbi:succinate dehydrogenase, cytochrome b556 subunit, partial [Ralstonia holmesii]
MAIDSENGTVIYRNIGLGDIARYRLPWAGKVSILHRA